jgi:hypothetical protein
MAKIEKPKPSAKARPVPNVAAIRRTSIVPKRGAAAPVAK